VRLAALALLLSALAVHAQTAHDPETVLAKVRDSVLDRSDRLPNYTCIQTVNRQYFKRETPEFPLPSCEQMNHEEAVNAYSLTLEATDRLRLEVKISDGEEISAWAGASHFEKQTVGELAGGPFSTGSFGSFLMDIFDASNVQFAFEGEEVVEGSKLLRFRFQVPKDSSHYMVHDRSEWIVTAYDGSIWVDPDSSELKRLSVRTAELPEETKACETTTVVDYAMTPIGAGKFLLPRQSNMHFLLRNTTERDVSVAYSACHQFMGEAKLVADPSAIDEKAQAAPQAPIAFPPGLVLPLKLEQSVDTDTAAAGDVVSAKVDKPVRLPNSKQVLIPAGSIVRGRIVGMEHWLNSPPRFVVGIQLETVEINGVESQLYATQMRGGDRGRPIFLPQRDQSLLVSTLNFYSTAQHYVIPRGYAMNWITVPPPGATQP
jgi:hypothetical protein